MGSNTVAWASWGIVTPQPSVDGILLDPDFEKIGRSGRLWTRNEMIAALVADAAPEQHTIDIRDMSGRMVGPGLVLLTYVTQVEGRRARSSSLWRQSMKGWRVLHHQGTPIP